LLPQSCPGLEAHKERQADCKSEVLSILGILALCSRIKKRGVHPRGPIEKYLHRAAAVGNFPAAPRLLLVQKTLPFKWGQGDTEPVHHGKILLKFDYAKRPEVVN
jgi:hypothetical protein